MTRKTTPGSTIIVRVPAGAVNVASANENGEPVFPGPPSRLFACEYLPNSLAVVGLAGDVAVEDLLHPPLFTAGVKRPLLVHRAIAGELELRLIHVRRVAAVLEVQAVDEREQHLVAVVADLRRLHARHVLRRAVVR